MSEELREVFRTSHEARSKYTYYLLAVAGACIGFALTQTRDASISWWQLPLALAAGSWLLSFYFGCRHLQFASSLLYANSERLQVESGSHPQVGTNPWTVLAVSQSIRESESSNAKKAERRSLWQFWLLVAGGLIYIAWHITGMWLRTAAAAVSV